MKNFIILAVVVLLVAIIAAPLTVEADHGWTFLGYQLHWARGSNLTIHSVDHISSDWVFYYNQAQRDWHKSKVINVVKADEDVCDSDWNCMEVFSGNYGQSGWLGLASVSGYIDFDNDMIHLTYGQAIMNDYYYTTEPYAAVYGTPEWRAVVMCQEIGHVFGLGHNDENFNNPSTGTCMDYSTDPGPNQHPDAHDMELLQRIYAHNDVVVYNANPRSAAFQNQPQISDFGELVEQSGHESVYVKDLGDNWVKITFVTHAVEQ